MSHHRRAIFVVPIVLGLLLGCASDRTAAAQPTPAPIAPTAALASPAATSALAKPTAATSPRIAAAPRAQLGSGSPAIGLETVAGGLGTTLYATHAGDGSGRLFVVDKRGRILIVRDGSASPTIFLDISGLVNSSGSEQGLLGLAFHPSYAANGSFYVNYTDRVGIGNTVVARYQVSADNPDAADPASAATLLYLEQPAQNHNGGHLAFGPDGYLYIGTGDGGRAGDPWGNAQNKGVLLGKMLRIDVNGGPPYGIPLDNPFVNEPGARPEIWAYGLRNPWRYSFDRATGDFYIGDVGQNRWEWVHFQRAGTPGGQNYGWNQIEGSHCYPPGRACDPNAFVLPVAEYGHGEGCSITGGYVYRGQRFPQLAGIYFYGDYCSGRIWGLQEQAPGQWSSQPLLESGIRVSSFGEDEAGEVYVTGLSDGTVYRLVAQ